MPRPSTAGRISKATSAHRQVKESIEAYWRDIDGPRFAMMHGKPVGIHESILLHFDSCTIYGPSHGISRRERWERAEKFGLHPPKEVLEVLNDGGDMYEVSSPSSSTSSTASSRIGDIIST